MNLYTIRLGELAAHLDIGAIEQDETGHACLTLDKLWAIHLAPLGEESLVMFLRAGTLAGEAQARRCCEATSSVPSTPSYGWLWGRTIT